MVILNGFADANAKKSKALAAMTSGREKAKSVDARSVIDPELTA